MAKDEIASAKIELISKLLSSEVMNSADSKSKEKKASKRAGKSVEKVAKKKTRAQKEKAGQAELRKAMKKARSEELKPRGQSK